MLVCWSGGCDSTLALAMAARELASQPECGGGQPVRALSVVHPQVPALTEGERARRELLPRLRRLCSRRKWAPVEHTVVTLRQRGQFFATRGTGLAQPLIWLGEAVSYLELEETLVLGYVHGDDFWHHRQEFLDGFGALQRVAGKSGKLWLPLEWLCKAEVIHSLKRLGLYGSCWYCEDPVYKGGGKSGAGKLGRACGRCCPCVAHLTGQWQLARGLVVPDDSTLEVKKLKADMAVQAQIGQS